MEDSNTASKPGFEPQESAAKFERFLARRLPQAKSIQVTDCGLMTGGYNSIMTRFTVTIDGATKKFAARAALPPDQLAIETDRQKEWEVLSALTKLGTVPMPNALFFDIDGSELGHVTIVLEFADGGPFLAKLRATGEDQRPAQAQALCDLTAAIHATDISVLPPSVKRPRDWDSYIDELIDTWRKTEAKLRDSVPLLRYMAVWLDENRPPPAPLSLVHGEYQVSNTILDGNGQLMAIDWEYAHIGDPREDIGYCKWVESMLPPALIAHDEEAFLQRYRERSGLSRDVINPQTVAYFSILGGMRVFSGALMQQEAFIEGSKSGIHFGYIVGAIVSAYEGWFNATRQIETTKESRVGQ